MRIHGFFVVLFLLCTSHQSRAGGDVAYSFSPDPATVDESINFRVDFTGCYDYPVNVVVDEQQKIIRANIAGSDAGCDETNPGNYLSPKLIPVGLLPAGAYKTEVILCGILAPPPAPSCELVEEGSLIVRSVGGLPATIPASSGFGKALLVFLFLMVGIEVIRRR